MNPFRADLHCHSYFSDGEDSPFELIAKAKAADLQGLSITDHDTLDAYTPELFTEAKRQEVRLVTGVELSSEFRGLSIHILGYGFDLTASSFHTFLEEMRTRRRGRNLAILKKLKANNMPIAEEELLNLVNSHNTTIGRPHIAELMVRKKYVTSHREAFEKYLREGACCHAFGIKFHPKEAIEQILLAKGIPVLAHPHFIPKGSILREVLSFPFQGIECYYGTLDKTQEQPWLEVAAKRGWIATGGSDYHGKVKPHVSLGCSWVGESTFKALFQPKEDSGTY